MRKFSRELAQCPKCGFGVPGLTVTYVNAALSKTMGLENTLRLRCAGCNYQWNELPMDYVCPCIDGCLGDV